MGESRQVNLSENRPRQTIGMVTLNGRIDTHSRHSGCKMSTEAVEAQNADDFQVLSMKDV